MLWQLHDFADLKHQNSLSTILVTFLHVPIAWHVQACICCSCHLDNWLLQVLCTTSTLAMGVNLPAHLVVIKGTRRWCSGEEGPGEGKGFKEYDRTTCLQMIGRAGRPQFDNEGVAVIMTECHVRKPA